MEETAPVDLVQEQRNRGTGSVRVRLQVRLYPGKWDVEYLGDALQDAQCSLMRNDQRDVFESQMVDPENLSNTLRHRRGGLLKNYLSIHFEIGVPGIDSELIHALAVGEENARKETILPVIPFEHHCTGAVSKNDAVAVLPVCDLGKSVGAYHQDSLVSAILDELASDGDGINKPGTHRGHIKGRTKVGNAHLVFRNTCRRGHLAVWRRRGNDDQFNIVCFKPRRGDCGQPCMGGKV